MTELEEELTEILRLTTRAARRVTRDLRHAVDSIDNETERNRFRERHEMWTKVFFDTRLYRDDLHITISLLEARVESLKEQLRKAGIE